MLCTKSVTSVMITEVDQMVRIPTYYLTNEGIDSTLYFVILPICDGEINVTCDHYFFFLVGRCFAQQRKDYRLDYSTADDLTEASSISDCERQCINSDRFVCRGFSYR